MCRAEIIRLEWKKRIEDWQKSGINGQNGQKITNVLIIPFCTGKSQLAKKKENSPLSFIEFSDHSIFDNYPLELVISNITIMVNKGFVRLTLKSCLELVRSLSKTFCCTT